MSGAGGAGGGKRVVLYTTGWCGQCRDAKALLARRGVAYEEVDAEALWGDRFRDEIFARTGQLTVPQLVVDGEPLGGWSDMLALDERGGLKELAGPAG